MAQQDLILETLHDNTETGELSEFIEQASNGTIFHRPRFLSYHGAGAFPAPEYAIHHLVFRHKGRIAGFLPGILQTTGGVTRYRSPYGASFGGLVTRDISFETGERMVDMMIDHLVREKGVTGIELTPPTAIYRGGVHDDLLDYLYRAKGFRPVSCDLTLSTEIIRHEDFPRMVLRDRVRSAVSQSQRKGITCEVCEDVDIAYPIIEADQRKFGKSPTHSAADLKVITALFPGRIQQFIAYKADQPVAAVSLFLCNARVGYSFYIDQLEEYADCRPVDLLLVEVLAWMKERSFRYLDLGPSTFGFEPHRSLIFFKEGFGGKGVMRNRYLYEATGRKEGRG